MAPNPIPDDYPRMSASLAIDGAAEAIEFYRSVLGATVRGGVFTMPDGKVGHAELTIGDSLFMVADEFPDMGFLGPLKVGGSPVTLSVYVEDVDATHAAAIAAGATEMSAPENQFYGHRTGRFVDPWGHRWNVSSVVEEIGEEEMARRAAEFDA